MKQLLPDWSEIMEEGQFNYAFGFPFEYTHPGLYLSNTDTVLVQKDDAGYLHVHVYNCNLRDTVFAETLPTQWDSRD